MTGPTPTVRHARWCDGPPLRQSADMFDRFTRIYRCPQCGARVAVVGGQVPLPLDTEGAK